MVDNNFVETGPNESQLPPSSSEDFETVKKLKIKQVKADADEKIKQAEKEFEENIFML